MRDSSDRMRRGARGMGATLSALAVAGCMTKAPAVVPAPDAAWEAAGMRRASGDMEFSATRGLAVALTLTGRGTLFNDVRQCFARVGIDLSRSHGFHLGGVIEKAMRANPALGRLKTNFSEGAGKKIVLSVVPTSDTGQLRKVVAQVLFPVASLGLPTVASAGMQAVAVVMPITAANERSKEMRAAGVPTASTRDVMWDTVHNVAWRDTLSFVKNGALAVEADVSIAYVQDGKKGAPGECVGYALEMQGVEQSAPSVRQATYAIPSAPVREEIRKPTLPAVAGATHQSQLGAFGTEVQARALAAELRGRHGGVRFDIVPEGGKYKVRSPEGCAALGEKECMRVAGAAPAPLAAPAVREAAYVPPVSAPAVSQAAPLAPQGKAVQGAFLDITVDNMMAGLQLTMALAGKRPELAKVFALVELPGGGVGIEHRTTNPAEAQGICAAVHASGVKVKMGGVEEAVHCVVQ